MEEKSVEYLLRVHGREELRDDLRGVEESLDELNSVELCRGRERC